MEVDCLQLSSMLNCHNIMDAVIYYGVFIGVYCDLVGVCGPKHNLG